MSDKSADTGPAGLADILVDQLLFLATADDDVLDPDVAAQQLEALTADLVALPRRERDAVREVTRRRISSARDDDSAASLTALVEALDDQPSDPQDVVE